MNIGVLVVQLGLTLCDLMDCSPPGSSVHGILQATILEWVIIPFSKGSSPPRNWTQVSCIVGRFFTTRATKEAHECRMHVYYWIIVFSGYMHRSAIAGSYGNSIFSFLRNLHIVLHSGCNNLHSHPQRTLHPLQHLLSVDILIIVILEDWCEVVSYCSFHLHFSNN